MASRALPLLAVVFALTACSTSLDGTHDDAGNPGDSVDGGAEVDGATSPPSDAAAPPDAAADVAVPAPDAGPFDPPDAPGPFAFDTHLDEVATADGSLKADYFVPRGAWPHPVVFLRHGYTRGKQNLRGWGQRLASHGFVTVLPSTNDSGTATTGQVDLEAVVAFTMSRGSVSGSFLMGKLDASRIVLGGHSSGGLAATLAAAGGKVTVAGLVLLDTEAAPEGVAAAAKINAPGVGAFAEPDMSGSLSCNEEGGGVNTAAALAGPIFSFRVPNASHCDLESDSDGLCAAACGSISPDRLAAYETYVTGFLQLMVRCDARALPWVDGSIVANDTHVRILVQKNVGAACP